MKRTLIRSMFFRSLVILLLAVTTMAGPVLAEAFDITVRLEDSSGLGLEGGDVEYFHHSTDWQTIGTTDSLGEVSATLAVTPTRVKMIYEQVSNTNTDTVDIGDGTVVFQTIDVQVTLKTCEAVALEGGVAEYQGINGLWQPFGTTDNDGEVNREMLPANRNYRMTYAYSAYRFFQDTLLDPVVNFLTTAVTLGWDGIIEYQRSYWRPFTSPTMELLPGTYLFKVTNDPDPVIREWLEIEGCEFTYPEAINTPPVADAGGPYLVAVGQTIMLDGTGSYDADMDFLSYLWTQDELLGFFNDPSLESPDFSGVQAGMTDLMLTVHDGMEDNSDTAIVVVYDPSGGFVTGGGWIFSDPGNYVPDPELEGKANFGFVSKYKKGANVPTGNTEFQFKTAGLNFHSTDYDWLVVNQGGENAQFKGAGTINGTGNYKFMLWAGDGEPDTFRIKIWEEIDGVEWIRYDNGFHQSLGGGSIVIHTPKKK